MGYGWVCLDLLHFTSLALALGFAIAQKVVLFTGFNVVCYCIIRVLQKDGVK